MDANRKRIVRRQSEPTFRRALPITTSRFEGAAEQCHHDLGALLGVYVTFGGFDSRKLGASTRNLIVFDML